MNFRPQMLQFNMTKTSTNLNELQRRNWDNFKRVHNRFAAATREEERMNRVQSKVQGMKELLQDLNSLTSYPSTGDVNVYYIYIIDINIKKLVLKIKNN